MTAGPTDGDERERRRDSFLGGAEDYFAARPGYPPEILEAAVRLARLSPGARLLEVGCGTGEVTVWFASRGFPITALDRSPAMIRLARRRLRGAPEVDVRVQDFEREPPRGRYAGLILATAYHWLDPDSRARRCADALRGDGSLMLLWHTHPMPYRGFHQRSQAIYERMIPGWEPPASPGMSEQKIEAVVQELRSSGLFPSIARTSYDWSRTYERDLYLRLLSTYSDHRLLAAGRRRRLFDELAELIDGEFGGAVERPYRTELIVARRRQERVDDAPGGLADQAFRPEPGASGTSKEERS